MTDEERLAKKINRAEYVRDRRLADLEAHRAADRKSYADNKEKRLLSSRKNHMKSNYGISLEQYEARLCAQDNACAICRSKDPAGKGSFHVDHCHETKRVRGLLCHHCNVGLGNFKDNPVSLTAAIQYLAT